MDVDRQGIVADDVISSASSPRLAFKRSISFSLHLAAGVGHVASAVDKAGDADAGAAAEDLHAWRQALAAWYFSAQAWATLTIVSEPAIWMLTAVA